MLVVTLFGMLSAVFTLGSGPLAIDAWLQRSPDREGVDSASSTPTDA